MFNNLIKSNSTATNNHNHYRSSNMNQRGNLLIKNKETANNLSFDDT